MFSCLRSILRLNPRLGKRRRGQPGRGAWGYPRASTGQVHRGVLRSDLGQQGPAQRWLIAGAMGDACAWVLCE